MVRPVNASVRVFPTVVKSLDCDVIARLSAKMKILMSGWIGCSLVQMLNRRGARTLP